MKMRKCSCESTRSRYNTVIMTKFLYRFRTPCEIFWQLMRDGCVYRVGREQYHWVPYIFSKLGTPRYNLWEFVLFLHILAFCMNCFWSPHQFPNSSVFKISRNTSLFSLVTPWPRTKHSVFSVLLPWKAVSVLLPSSQFLCSSVVEAESRSSSDEKETKIDDWKWSISGN